MTWGLVFRVRQYVKGSLWLVPVLGGVTGSLLGIAVTGTGTIFDLPASWTYSAGTAQAVLAALVGAGAELQSLSRRCDDRRGLTEDT